MSTSSTSLSRQLVIDDTDPRIQYTGIGWFEDNGGQDGVGNLGPTYNHTQHGTNSTGSLAYPFTGTFVKLLGSTSSSNWGCYIDGVQIPTTSPAETQQNNEVLCEQSFLSHSPHVVTLNITTTGIPFWFDSIRFIPLPGATLTTARLLINNPDPGITYDPTWITVTNPEGTLSTRVTTTFGSQMRFNFTGTGLSWIGIAPSGFPNTPSSGSYSIDGGSATSFNLNGLPPGTNDTLYNQPIFSTPELQQGFHTLLVTYNGKSEVTPLTLQYLLISNSTALQAPNSSPTSTGSGNGPSQKSDAASPHKHSLGPLIGGIVGGVVGALLLFCLVLFLLSRIRRKKQRIACIETSSASVTSGPHRLAPFMSWHQREAPFPSAPFPQATAAFVVAGDRKQVMPLNTAVNQVSPTIVTTRSPVSAPTPPAPLNPSRHKQDNRAHPGGSRPVTAPAAILTHQDSGIRLQRGEVPIIEVPPLYSPT